MNNEIINRVKMGVNNDIQNSGKGTGVAQDEFVWGEYVQKQSISGVVCLEGDLYVYKTNDFGACTFLGPFNEQEAIGYISTFVYGVQTAGKNWSFVELYDYNENALHSFAEVQTLAQKKLNSLLDELNEDEPLDDANPSKGGA